MSPVKRKKESTRKSRPKAKTNAAEVQDELGVIPVGLIRYTRSYVFYGGSGTGKTTVAGTFPTPHLLLDINDQGTESVMDIEGIDVKKINTWDDFELVYWWLKKNPKKYKTLTVDTVTQLQQVAIEKVLTDNDKDPSQAGGWGAMTKREWGQLSALMKEWITNLRDLPMEVIFLAQERLTESEIDDPEVQLSPEVGPRLSPSVASHLCAEVQVVGCTFIRRKVKVKRVRGKKKEVSRIQYCMRLGPDPIYTTKARKPKAIKLPSVLVDPTYDSLTKSLKGEKDNG